MFTVAALIHDYEDYSCTRFWESGHFWEIQPSPTGCEISKSVQP